ncbi:MAG: hypothetical protein H8E85_05700 [Candidatus Marinimicrobia bacterium]|nr:hypothetical protein [Candidatus Neomarinimicrobiota bacterium]
MKKYFLFIFISFTCITAQVNGNAKTKLQSMILPGWGEKTLGASERANNFFIREAALWLIYIGGKKTSVWYESDYTAFAELHADVDMTGKDYLFVVNLGHYNSLDIYNDTKERKRLVNDKYKEGEGFEWQWDNSDNRIIFDEMRIKSASFNKYAKFAVGGLILHRMVSFFDVIYLERTNFNMSVEPQLSPATNSMRINLSLKF